MPRPSLHSNEVSPKSSSAASDHTALLTPSQVVKLTVVKADLCAEAQRLYENPQQKACLGFKQLLPTFAGSSSVLAGWQGL